MRSAGEGAEGVILRDHFRAGARFPRVGHNEAEMAWNTASRYCTGNSRVAFAVSLAFAAPCYGWLVWTAAAITSRGIAFDGVIELATKAATSGPASAALTTTAHVAGKPQRAGGMRRRRNDAATCSMRSGRWTDAGRQYRLHMLANGQARAVPVRTASCAPEAMVGCCSFNRRAVTDRNMQQKP